MVYCLSMRISLIALDLDDTLLAPDLSIPPANRDAVGRALEAGIPVILASGRTIDSMLPYARELGMDGRGLPMICVNGAEVRDVDTQETLRRLTLSPADCTRIIEIVTGLGLPVQAYEDGRILVSRRNGWTEEDSRLTGLPNRIATPGELASLPRSKLLAAGEPEHIRRVLEEARRSLAGVAELLVSKPCFLEILPPGADKGHALAWIARRLGVERENVMAIGDSGNDIGMVAWAGTGCAPSDARADVLAVARFVSSLPHDRGAVAELLARFAPGS